MWHHLKYHHASVNEEAQKKTDAASNSGSVSKVQENGNALFPVQKLLKH